MKVDIYHLKLDLKQANSVKKILEDLGYININVGKDLNLNDRYVYAMKGKNESK